MFWRVIWDKLSECIFKNFEIAQVKQAFSKFLKMLRVIYPKNDTNQTWLLVNQTKAIDILY